MTGGIIGGVSPGLQIFLSFTLTFGVPLVLASRELLTLRRGGGRRSRGRGWEDGFVPSPPPIAPLPACLVPVMTRPPGGATRNIRELELA